MAKHNFVIGYPGRWVWINQELIPTKTVAAPVVSEIEEVCMVGEVAEKTMIPARSGKWISVVALSASEGKAVVVSPKKKYRDQIDLLFANSIDNGENGVVPAWVVNTSERERELDLFEELAEVAECDLPESKPPDDDDEIEGNFEFSGFTLPTVKHEATIAPKPSIIRDMNSPEGRLLYDVLQKVKLQDEVEEPLWGVDLAESTLTKVQRAAYIMIIHQFADIFAQDDQDLGHTHWVKHAIDTGDADPIRSRTYRAPLTLRKALEEMIDAMERQGVVKKAIVHGPHLSCWFQKVMGS